MLPYWPPPVGPVTLRGDDRADPYPRGMSNPRQPPPDRSWVRTESVTQRHHGRHRQQRPTAPIDGLAILGALIGLAILILAIIGR